MAGTIIESPLTPARSPATQFALATEADDAAIRRLLRDNPMRGAISLSFEREPDYFGSINIAGAEDQVILAFENKRLACMGRCSISERYVNGEVRRVGYLSDLRLDQPVQGRFDILRRGYQFFHQLQREHPADLYFTSITADNERSLRFLQRGLPGMPVYEPLTEFVTLFIPVPRRPAKLSDKNIVPGSPQHLPALVEFLNRQATRHNLVTVWNEEKIQSLAQHGLGASDFTLLFEDKTIAGCAALWDQRRFKQTVIRGYDGALSFARPFMNLAAGIFGTPRLPATGNALNYAFLSPLTASSEIGLLELVEASISKAAESGLEFIAVGLSAGDPRIAPLRDGFRCREYRNRLFRVQWPDFPAIHPGDRLPFPEIALL